MRPSADQSENSETEVQKTHYKKLQCIYEGWNFNSGNYLFTTDTK